jgi:hypothetical protein
MPFYYDNNMKHSEVPRWLPSYLRDWTQQGVKTLSLWYHGMPPVLGSFVEDPAGTYTMTAVGYGVWGNEDSMHFAFKTLNGPASITAKLQSVSQVNNSIEAGVMIRETLDSNSVNVSTRAGHDRDILDGSDISWIALRVRAETAGSTSTLGDVRNISLPPHWIKLERDSSDNFIASHANDLAGAPDQWTVIASTNVPMSDSVYIGLILSSYDIAIRTTVVFSDVTITGDVTGDTFTAQDIGIEGNAVEPMFVAIQDTAGRRAAVYNPDPNAALVTDWTEWGKFGQGIALSEFTTQTPNLDLSNVDNVRLGFGTKGNKQPGGTGLVFFDDFRLYKPRCIPQLAKPAADLNGNCIVDLPDFALLAEEWLQIAPNIHTDINYDLRLDFGDVKMLSNEWLDQILWP